MKSCEPLLGPRGGLVYESRANAVFELLQYINTGLLSTEIMNVLAQIDIFFILFPEPFSRLCGSLGYVAPICN
jgi:hypothetical protein